MTAINFYLLGDSPSSSKNLDIEPGTSLEDLRLLIAAHFAIVQPEEIGFTDSANVFSSVDELSTSAAPVAITIAGRAAREIPGPPGVPYAGNFFDVFPDHLGNHQRLFETYGPIIKTSSFGRTVYQTNDPTIAAVVFAESDFFTKEINEDHPLFPLKTQSAGVFLGDTDSPEWKVAHKFLPPALGPKAVRHYAPTMQHTVEESFAVFDNLCEQGQAWNVYQYMLKLGSQAVGQLTLGLDFNHFTSPDADLHEMVHLIAELLTLNKKVSSKGTWYGMLPFGDPQRLKNIKARIETLIEDSMKKAEQSGNEDLPLQEAALQASNMVDYAIRATDNQGNKLPKTSLTWALIVTTAAGFTTTSSLLSWLIYGLVTYEGMQERLLQELIDAGVNETTVFDADLTERLPFLDRYIKEMQRRHNPSFQPGRTARADLILPGGYKVPKGSVVIPALHHIHNNPNLWDNPHRFDPDRWETEEVKNRHKASYVPFATGQRMCIGFNFALQEVKIFLPKLIYRYKFFREGDGVVEYDPMFQLIRPNNLYVRAEKRVKWPPQSEQAE
ncbi:hypothetical protein Q7P37_010343 [Cladosporium fusiforme]